MGLFKKKASKKAAAKKAVDVLPTFEGDVVREQPDEPAVAPKPVVPPPKRNPRRIGAVDRMAGRTTPRS